MGDSDGGNASGGLELSEGAIVSIVRAEVRKQLSARVRDETVQALQVATAIPAAMARALGEVKRQDALGWSSRRQQQEDEYLARARAN